MKNETNVDTTEGGRRIVSEIESKFRQERNGQTHYVKKERESSVVDEKECETEEVEVNTPMEVIDQTKIKQEERAIAAFDRSS